MCVRLARDATNSAAPATQSASTSSSTFGGAPSATSTTRPPVSSTSSPSPTPVSFLSFVFFSFFPTISTVSYRVSFLFFFGWIRLYRRSSALVGFSFSWTLVLLDYTVEYGYIIHGYSVQPLILAIFGRNRIFYIIKPSGYIIQPSGYIAATLRGARGEYLHRIWLFCTIQLALRG